MQRKKGKKTETNIFMQRIFNKMLGKEGFHLHHLMRHHCINPCKSLKYKYYFLMVKINIGFAKEGNIFPVSIYTL